MPIVRALWPVATGQSHSDSDPRQRRVVRKALTWLIWSASSLSARFGALVNALPGALKTNMAPETIRNSGDKGEGAQAVRMGKDKGDIVLVGRRPASTIMKPSGKPAAGLGKDVKNDEATPPLPLPSLDVRGKEKIQPMITSFLSAGLQESNLEHIGTPKTDNHLGVKGICSAISGEGLFTQKELDLISLHYKVSTVLGTSQ
ncbi:hypothetical protein NDU88_003034 [Pleurodeles waltl]|uniref:Uncharacterized protein n=1 Tax=Pleurodeles waltl TaxID=8319 RepID=A0AAV7SF37_PLEWA|nr:hypothetical protein NDU88_003034 [Pleurodeles waltl]